MLETYLESPITRRRLRVGHAAKYIDNFANWLHMNGYSQNSIKAILRSLAGWTDWLLTEDFGADELVQGLEACKATLAKSSRSHYSRGPNRQSLTAATIFIKFLRAEHDLPPAPSKPLASELWPILGDYGAWMIIHRGVTESTLAVYQGILVGLLDTIGDDTSSYSASVLRSYVLNRASSHGIQRAKSIVVAIRSFCRYLGATGRCLPGMEHAIPTFASWQLASVPRYLAPGDVERVIGSCSDTALGVRDRAVLLLLARLGLRASEVAQLKFADIDWKNGSITIRCKARREDSLPLPQEVGDAILSYLKKVRPPLPAPEVFTTFLAPYRPLTRAAVTHIVRSALRKTGIKAPINGAHVLRHSAATAMLNQGASLAGVGAVLRHRSLMTTTHYAKVDFHLLSEVAQPWPMSC